MSATFTYKINGIRTATVGDKTNVVKQVDWAMIGTQDGQTFELPQSTTLSDPGENFIPFSKLTEAEVIAWVQATDTRIEAIQAHVQYVLDKESEKAALVLATMPWAPAVEEPSPAPEV